MEKIKKHEIEDKKLNIIEPIDAMHCRVNGCLVDVVAIKYWVESEYWAAHNPIKAVLKVEKLVRGFFEQPENCQNHHLIWLLLLDLSKLTCYGYWIRDEVFAVCTAAVPFFRLDNGCVTHKIVGVTDGQRQITEKWVSADERHVWGTE